jgi:hypothetical protein
MCYEDPYNCNSMLSDNISNFHLFSPQDVYIDSIIPPHTYHFHCLLFRSAQENLLQNKIMISILLY